jgi:CubicO group peptidase (beta-lactamase class C family)
MDRAFRYLFPYVADCGRNFHLSWRFEADRGQTSEALPEVRLAGGRHLTNHARKICAGEKVMALATRFVSAAVCFGLAGALGLGACTSAPAAEPANTLSLTEPGGFTPEGIAALEAAMANEVALGHVKGIATRLVQHGEIVSDMQAGVRRVEDSAPITEDTIYRIYSMSKPITGVALLMLYEEGAFTLDDPVTKFVPEFANLKVMTGVDEAGAPLLTDTDHIPTMREVMTHTAGFAYGLFGDDVANNMFRDQAIMQSPDLDTFIDKVADVPLLFQPGTKWSYSASVDVQGYVVQQISGMRFGEFLDTRLFEPLRMTDTGFYVPADDLDRFSDAFGYVPDQPELGLVKYDRPTVQFRKETIGMESGGGGLVGTMEDYTRFCQMLLNGGELDGVRILKPETVDLMRTNMLPDGAKLFSDGAQQNLKTDGLGFGLNVGLVLDPEASEMAQAAGSYFWGGAAGTWFWIDPENDLFFIGMIQRFSWNGPEVDFRRNSAHVVYDALVE